MSSISETTTCDKIQEFCLGQNLFAVLGVISLVILLFSAILKLCLHMGWIVSHKETLATIMTLTLGFTGIFGILYLTVLLFFGKLFSFSIPIFLGIPFNGVFYLIIVALVVLLAFSDKIKKWFSERAAKKNSTPANEVPSSL